MTCVRSRANQCRFASRGSRNSDFLRLGRTTFYVVTRTGRMSLSGRRGARGPASRQRAWTAGFVASERARHMALPPPIQLRVPGLKTPRAPPHSPWEDRVKRDSSRLPGRAHRHTHATWRTKTPTGDRPARSFVAAVVSSVAENRGIQLKIMHFASDGRTQWRAAHRRHLNPGAGADTRAAQVPQLPTSSARPHAQPARSHAHTRPLQCVGSAHAEGPDPNRPNTPPQ